MVNGPTGHTPVTIRIVRALPGHGDFSMTMLRSVVLQVSVKVSRRGRWSSSEEVT